MLPGMPKPILIVIILVALGIGGFVGYQAYQKNAGGAAASAGVAPGPQAGDPVLEGVTPEDVMGAVAGQRKQADQEAMAANFVGKWIAPGGWQGPVQVITDESGGKGYRMQYTMKGLLTNEFWVVAVVPDGRQYFHGFEPEARNFITYGGKIDKVEVIPPNSYKPVPDYRIVVKDAYVISINGR